ncbi:MAG: riboflavin synthase [Candidatus Nanopelagicales bacterium]
MFTGIVEELGTIVAVEDLPGDARRLTMSGPLVTSDASLGDSIAVNGVCLTVSAQSGSQFTADVMRETLVRSSLRDVTAGTPVNLERPVTLSTRLGGHLVQGHVDGVGVITAREPSENWEVVTIQLPADLARYVVEKGSITVDGVSLTVVAVGDNRGASTDTWFSISLIPTTLDLTTLGLKQPGDLVNLEVDVLAKYVERLMTPSENG